MRWQVLYVRSRAEKKVSERLSQKGFETFCPCKTEVRQWSDRKKKVKVPYFRSYVFVRLAATDKLKVLQTPGAVRFLYWLGKPAIIRDSEMKQVIAFFKKYRSRPIQQQSFSRGDRIKIKKGPLKNRSAVVVEQRKNSVVLQIEQLNMTLRVQIDAHKVGK